MVELKIFYDKAKIKKDKLENEFKDKLQSLEKSKQNNIITLVKNFNERMKVVLLRVFANNDDQASERSER